MENLNSFVDKIVVVDPGKNAVKVLVFTPNYELLERYVFPSKSKKKRNFADIDGSSENQYKVEINGDKYVVGDGIQECYNFETTKNNLHHKLCVYTAIGKAVSKKNEKIYLIVGYPSSDFTNEISKDEYVELLSSDKAVEMVINKEEKKFIISSINVLPEGIALKPRMINSGKIVHVNDIGGQNLNYRLYDAKGNTLNSFSLDKAGINHLEEFFRTQLRKFIDAEKVSVEAIDVLNAIIVGRIPELNDAYLTNYANSAEFVEDTVLTFLENNIFFQLNSKGVNLYQRGYFIIFTGGGSLLLKPYIEKLIENNQDNMYFSNTAQWDNCISYTVKDLGDRCKAKGILKEAQLLGKKVLDQTEEQELSLI